MTAAWRVKRVAPPEGAWDTATLRRASAGTPSWRRFALRSELSHMVDVETPHGRLRVHSGKTIAGNGPARVRDWSLRAPRASRAPTGTPRAHRHGHPQPGTRAPGHHGHGLQNHNGAQRTTANIANGTCPYFLTFREKSINTSYVPFGAGR